MIIEEPPKDNRIRVGSCNSRGGDRIARRVAVLNRDGRRKRQVNIIDSVKRDRQPFNGRYGEREITGRDVRRCCVFHPYVKPVIITRRITISNFYETGGRSNGTEFIMVDERHQGLTGYQPYRFCRGDACCDTRGRSRRTNPLGSSKCLSGSVLPKMVPLLTTLPEVVPFGVKS